MSQWSERSQLISACWLSSAGVELGGDSGITTDTHVVFMHHGIAKCVVILEANMTPNISAASTALQRIGVGVCSLLIEMQSYYSNSNDPLSQIPITDIFSIFLLGLVIQLKRIVYWNLPTTVRSMRSNMNARNMMMMAVFPGLSDACAYWTTSGARSIRFVELNLIIPPL